MSSTVMRSPAWAVTRFSKLISRLGPVTSSESAGSARRSWCSAQRPSASPLKTSMRGMAGRGVRASSGAKVRPLYEGEYCDDKHMQCTVAQPEDRHRGVMLPVGAQQKLHGRELLAILVDCACQPEVQEQGGTRQRNKHTDQPPGALRDRRRRGEQCRSEEQ